MEVKAFQDARNSELDAFKKQYAFLKGEYATALSSAIREPDPNKQQILIERVQKINGQLAEELRGMLGSLNKNSKGFDTKDLNELTNDLIHYQQEYRDIEKSKDKVNTLKRIKNTTAENLEKATFMYYVFIAILVLLSVYIAYLVFTTSWTQAFRKSVIQTPSLP
jgi:hypothetical protein